MAKDIEGLRLWKAEVKKAIELIERLRSSQLASEEDLVNLADAENSLYGVYDSLELLVNPKSTRKTKK